MSQITKCKIPQLTNGGKGEEGRVEKTSPVAISLSFYIWKLKKKSFKHEIS